MGGAMSLSVADLGVLLPIGTALVSAAFSAGMAYMSIRLLGQKIDSLKEVVDEVKVEGGVDRVRIDTHSTDIAVLKSQVGSLRAMRAVRNDHQQKDDAE